MLVFYETIFNIHELISTLQCLHRCTTMSTPNLSSKDLQDILTFVVDLARQAGDLILEGSEAIQQAPSDSGVGEKKNSVDLVTEYDVRVEELVKKALGEKYPSFGLSVSSTVSKDFL